MEIRPEPAKGRLPMKPINKALAIGLALALAWAIFLATAGREIGLGALKPPKLEFSLVTPTTDFQWPLVDPDGTPVSLADFKGRPILLNIWATWCPPCLEEMPSIAKLASNAQIKEKGIVILCVSTDESSADLKEFLKTHNWPMKIVRIPDQKIPPAFQTEFIPATFLIDPEGRIVSSQIGPALWDDLSVVDYLVKLAAPK
jgi:thiol-disulfide isomerase/thioredoxin